MDRDIFDHRLLFYGLDDFVIKRASIKAIFSCKSCKDQYLYKLYVYAAPFINDTWKDYMWDYLQSDISDLEFMLNYGVYKRKHHRD